MADRPILAAIRKLLHRHDWQWEFREHVTERVYTDGSREKVRGVPTWTRECRTCGKKESGTGSAPIA